MDRWSRDFRHGWRMLARNKGFSAIAILALAFGIGPNVAIFSIVWATFLAPLPYPQPDQMVVIWSMEKGERDFARADDYLQYVAQSHSFQRLDFQAWANAPQLTGSGPENEQEEETRGEMNTLGFYTKNEGVRLAMGRDFLPSETVSGNNHEVILTHRLWKKRFHADPQILQRQIRIDDQPYTVVGVYEAGVADRLPPRFVTPLALDPGGHNAYFGNVIGRLKPGVTIAQAQAEMSVIGKRLAIARGGDTPVDAFSISVEPLKNDWLSKKLERNLWLLLAAVGFVLLIACANLASLLLAKGASRQQEIAVRSAMGATRARVFTQLLIESLALAFSGGLLGSGLGWGLMKVFVAILPDLADQSSETLVEINLPVLAFALGVTIVSGVLAGCAPAWQASRLNLSEMLKQSSRSVGGRGRMRIQQWLVMAEFALAITLLSGAAMAMRSFWNLTHVDLGIRTDHVLTGNMLRPKGPPPGTSIVVANARQLLAKLSSLPGVQDASLSTGLPLQGNGGSPFTLAGRPASKTDSLAADLEMVTPSFFQTLDIRLVRGRFLNEGDQANAPQVIVVSQSFVDKFLPGVDPLDQRIAFPPPVFAQKNAAGQKSTATPASIERQIVGVFHDVRNSPGLTGETAPEMYVSFWQTPWPGSQLAVRTVLDPALMSNTIRNTVARTLPGYSVSDLETMQLLVDGYATSDRSGMLLFAGFAVLALLLAALGIYGVMAFAVAQRTHEIGLRMALGAQQRDAVLLILRYGMKLALFGTAFGLAGVFALGHLMRSTLYGGQSIDPASFAIVSVTLVAVALLASYLPARRSAKIDPIIALRRE